MGLTSTGSMTMRTSLASKATNTESSEEGYVEQIATLQTTVDDKANELTRLQSLVLQVGAHFRHFR